jgi:DNA invertase Pin-like site-specific DNA recombinase
MNTIAYIYSDPLLENPPDSFIWGLEIDRIYQDLGDRLELKKLLADCEKKPPNYLLIRRLDELGENLTQINDHIKQIEALNINIIATEQNYISSEINKNNQEKTKNALNEILAEIEENQRKNKLRQGHAKNRLNLLPPPGKATFGYRRGKDRYIIDRSTAPVVKDFFEQFLLFGSLRGAVRYLETRYGKKISVSTGQKWLTNPVYRGDLLYLNREIIPNTHTPILSRSQAAQIDRLLRRNRRLPPRTATASRSLAGLVNCAKCQLKMKITSVTSPSHQKEYLYLSSPNCPLEIKCPSIPYQDALETTIKRICEDLPISVKELNSPNPEGIKQQLSTQIKQKEEILQQLPTLKKEGILDNKTLQIRDYQLRLEISQLQEKLAQLPPANLMAIAQTVSIPQFWLDLSETERRFYFREFIRQIDLIRINPQNWQLKLIFIF